MRLEPSLSMDCDSQDAIIKVKIKIFKGKKHNIVQQLLETTVISLELVISKFNLAYSINKPLNRKLVEQTLRRIGLMFIIGVKADGNLTC